MSRGGKILLGAALALVALLLGGQAAAGLYTDALWFDSLGYASVFWTRIRWEWGMRLLAGVVAGGVAALNLRIVASTVGAIQIKRRYGNIEIAEQLPRFYVTLTLVGVALLVGFWFAAAIPSGAGIRALLYVNGPEWGLTEPVLGRDLGFFLFHLPVQSGVVTFLLVLLFLVILISGAGYAVTGALRWDEGRVSLSDVPRVHLAGLVALVLLVLSWRYVLSGYVLLLDGHSAVDGIFGYADAHARLPGYRIIAGIGVVAAVGVVWSGLSERLWPAAAGVGAFIVAAIVAGHLYPGFIQRFRVEPNQLDRETPYIEHALEHTRRGFGLHRMDRRRLPYGGPGEVGREDAGEQLSALPVWSRSTLLSTYRQREARFRYYDFHDVTFDRYGEPGAEGPAEQVGISVREVDPGGIEDPNWQNLHLRERYLAGAGGVASPLTRSTGQGQPVMYLTGIPPVQGAGTDPPPGLGIPRPSIYVGSESQPYAAITPTDSAFLGPGGRQGRPGTDFPTGIALNSLLREVALAWRFQDANLLFASEVTDSTRFVFRRSVEERIRALTPFLTFPEDPYAVVHDGRVVWIVEGFTTARSFPLSTAFALGGRRQVNYVRNSVKVTVDALTGAVRFYVADPGDRLLAGYAASFPGLFRPLDEMPDGLRSHIRYPTTLLRMQAGVLLQYHQETASIFHEQEDVWAFARELGESPSPVRYAPAYSTFRLPDEESAEFLLSTVFVPVGRPNLTAMLVGRSDPEHYGELVLYEVRGDEQVPGTRQVEALVEQDPRISEQFSLWRQGGSEVWSGHLHVVPVGRSLLYMEPVFLAAQDGAIPELARYVVSDGRDVAMEPTLEGALEALFAGKPPTVSGPGRGTPPAREEGAVPGEAGELEWPREALDLLEEAEERLRAGDWAGFGAALERLRGVLNRAAGSGSGGGG